MKTKWGVLGSAGIARRRTIPEGITRARNVQLTAVYDLNTAANRDVAAQFQSHAAGTEADLLKSDCDIVYVATPANLHHAQVIRLAEAGKHVLCEKPLGLTLDEGREMIEACRQNGVKLGTGFMMRFHAQHQAALDLIREGRLGKLTLGRAQLSCWYPPIQGAWRQDPIQGGGGSLMDMGGHCIDLLEMFFGRAQRVSCFAGNLVQDYASEDTAVAILEFENGAKGIVDTLFCVPDASSRNRLELYGANGSILADGTVGQGERGSMTAYIENSTGGYDAQQSRDASGGFPIDPAPVNMYQAEVEAFAQAVLDNTDPPVSGEDGLWSQKVLLACYESARTGQSIDLTE